MLYALFYLIASDPEPATNVKTVKSNSFFKDEPARTRYGYISGYTGDDEKGHFFVLAMTCGYSLMRTSPSFDRILLIPSEMEISPKRIKQFRRVWTHIIRRPYIRWPDGYIDTHAKDMYLWFKLNAFSVNGWEKLLWTGTDVVFRKDPSSIFDYPAPCSIIDHYVYGMSHLGPVTNGDFFLFRPSLRDFAGLKRLGLLWSRDPDYFGKKIQMKGASWTGPHDQGLITQYFDGNITTAPQWYQLEVPGNPRSMLGFNNTLSPDPRVISFHFPSLIKPWKKDIGNYSRAWSRIAHECFDYFNETIDLIGIGFPPPTDVHPNLKMLLEYPTHAEPATGISNDDGIDPKLLFPQTLFKRRQRLRIILFIVFVNLLLYSIISKSCFPQTEYNVLE